MKRIYRRIKEITSTKSTLPLFKEDFEYGDLKLYKSLPKSKFLELDLKELEINLKDIKQLILYISSNSLFSLNEIESITQKTKKLFKVNDYIIGIDSEALFDEINVEIFIY